MANETLSLSVPGYAALRRREGAVLHYYNDVANHCTFGVGTLAHHGPCTEEELRRTVTSEEVDLQLAMRVKKAEVAVRSRVKDFSLTQAQFDALVSFTFNTGVSGARKTLDSANSGHFREVIVEMQKNVYVHPRDSKGRRLRAVRIQGLVIRRIEESAPFKRETASK
ncbi:lysozyme [Limnobacter sp.]|uniref:lysozyme n=1 Tax=Limnobacter sp. TaxID=2003368 RepID=UPI002E333AF6|nr:lysozyme [Limnobacter sp.]